MKNQREKRPDRTPGWQFVSNIDDCNAVFRSFGNSVVFRYATLTKDIELARNLSPVGVFYLFVEDESVFEIFKKFTYKEITFSRMVGTTVEINPHGVKIGKDDVIDCYLKYYEESKNN